jgi:hypothetical protein
MNEDIAQKSRENLSEFSIKKKNKTYALVAVKMELGAQDVRINDVSIKDLASKNKKTIQRKNLYL